MSTTSYVIISPVRNEAAYLSRTIESVVSQSLRPVCWILVNDGSSDETASVIDEAAARYPWIRAVHRPDRGCRRAGTGVMEAFYSAYDLIKDFSWDFIVKLDGDLSFESDYFQKCLEVFQQESRLGIAGGLVCIERNGKLEEEYPDPAFHVRGPTKIYRRECWESIGGLISAPGWDTFDIVRANMMGWRTRTIREMSLQHHRPTGGAYGSWANWVKNGYANYIVGYHPLFMVLKCARRFLRYPYGLAGIALMAGYIRGYVKRLPKVEDRAAIRYLRMQQMNHLLRRPSLWSMSLPER